jgi:hypothetical protein
MASFVLKDVEVIVNAVDLSDHVLSATINQTVDLVEDTAMGTNGTRSRVAGLLDWSFDVTFKQDFAAANVDATIFPLVGAAAFEVTVMANATAGVSATNPRYTGNVVVATYPPFGGNVGELAQVTVSFQAAGALTRAVV